MIIRPVWKSLKPFVHSLAQALSLPPDCAVLPAGEEPFERAAHAFTR